MSARRQMCAQTHGPSRGQTQIAVTVNASVKIRYPAAYSAPWRSEASGISRCKAVRERSRESVVECCMAVTRTTRLVCHREFRLNGSEKVSSPYCPRIDANRIAARGTFPSALARVLPLNSKKEGRCLLRKRSSTPARFAKGCGSRAMRWRTRVSTSSVNPR